MTGNPVGYTILFCVLALLERTGCQAFEPVPFTTERSTILKRESGTEDGTYWMHARAAMIPKGDHPLAKMVIFKFLGRSDFYSGMYTLSSRDAGETWTEPELRKELDWIGDGNVNIAVADVTPGWHEPSGKLIAIGAQVRYSEEGKQLNDKTRSHQTAYTVYDPERANWSRWRAIEMPAGEQFDFARNACGQWHVEDDGTLLLPFYIGPGVHKPFSTTMVRCRFDGKELVYLEHGNVLDLDVKRGLYEPSVLRFRDRYFLTMRNDLKGYVSVSNDGLNYAPEKEWTFDDGGELGSYNTQQHWLSLGEGDEAGLFLVYTRKGADNDHVFRHRAPLFIAQVDPEKLVVMRATEQILVPESGATLGNSGVTYVDADESWITVAEANVDRPEAKARGAEGSVFLVKVRKSAE